MKHTAKAFLILLVAAVQPCLAGWTVQTWPPKLGLSEFAVITYSTNAAEGHDTFAGSVGQLEADGHLERLHSVQFHALALLHDDKFQQEIMNELDRSAPEALKQALNSAGNLHNPKLEPLYGPFMKAVLTTSVVKKIADDLAVHGLEVKEATGDKFMILTEQGKRYFYFGLAFEIGKRAEQGSRTRR